MVHSYPRLALRGMAPDRLSSIGVDVEPRERGSANQKLDAVSAVEQVADGVEWKRNVDDFSRDEQFRPIHAFAISQPHDPVGYIEAIAIWPFRALRINIQQHRENICIRCIARYV